IGDGEGQAVGGAVVALDSDGGGAFLGEQAGGDQGLQLGGADQLGGQGGVVPQDGGGAVEEVAADRQREGRAPLRHAAGAEGCQRRATQMQRVVAGAAVVGGEEQGPVHVRQGPWVGAAGAGVDVGDAGGAGGGAVRLPHLVAVGAVVGPEEQRPVHVC